MKFLKKLVTRTKNGFEKKCLFIFLLTFIPITVHATPIVYYDLNFEDGSLGGGYTFGSFGLAENVDPSNLDGKALNFELNDQLVWDRNDVDSDTHYVGFDYYAEDGANITQFLDIPKILRLDVSETGRHRVDVYYDLSSKTVQAYLDGSLTMSLLTILAWQDMPSAQQIRIGNQIVGPGNSKGTFQIDNLVWKGNVEMASVPEPATMLLLGTALAGFAGTRLRRKKK